MKWIPIGGKQIDYVTYDDELASMSVHYCSGEVRDYPQIRQEDYIHLLETSNPYDCLLQITQGNLIRNQPAK